MTLSDEAKRAATTINAYIHGRESYGNTWEDVVQSAITAATVERDKTIAELDRQVTLNRENWRIDSEEKGRKLSDLTRKLEEKSAEFLRVEADRDDNKERRIALVSERDELARKLETAEKGEAAWFANYEKKNAECCELERKLEEATTTDGLVLLATIRERDAALAEVARLKAEVPEDKARLDWLQKWIETEISVRITEWDHDGRRYVNGALLIRKFKARGGNDETLREAIDAARKAE